MDFTTLLKPLLPYYGYMLALIILTGILKTPWFKGLTGEWWVRSIAKLRLPKDIYHPIHNVTLPMDDGSTQIDHIFVSVYGIFVVETKNMKGWIFGSERQAQWTQKIFRSSFKFQNPLRQNYRHLKALEAALDVPPETLHSVVAFMGECSFKTAMPANVTLGGGYCRYIRSFKESVLSEAEVSELVTRIQSGRLAPGLRTHFEHVAGLRRRHEGKVQGQGDPLVVGSKARPEAALLEAERLCPKCGQPMVQRTAKRGANAGGQFWGCSQFPKCRAMAKVGAFP
ncbi:NERD domain-containing protein [Gallaecimonas kandeliae]|uniref:nuclease-related domain-containing protein n=1 Tax=Gallaecimonas kandeliae TaxID=3029055 RepID=UPI0026475E2B|nr:NERD domain-containing protein [Gallaecimonas kandeliae]WKE65315.1 NERD domain-containing protein [Gallaecimonas kandeliae]